MKTNLVLALLLIATCLAVAIGTPQQNVSGNALVSIFQGGNTATVTASSALKVDPSGITQPVSGTVTANAGSGTMLVGDGSGPLTVDGSFSSSPLTACGGTNYDSGIVTLPNSTTVLTSTATCVTAVILMNLTTSQQTVTVTDGQGSPANLIPPSYDIPAKSSVVFSLYGTRALSGIKWSATNASAVAGIVRGNQ